MRKVIIAVLLLSTQLLMAYATLDTNHVRTLYLEADSLLEYDSKAALQRLATLDSIFRDTPFPEMEWKVVVLKGNDSKNNDRYEEALEYYEMAHKMVSETNDVKAAVTVKVNIASAKSKLGLKEEALNLYDEIFKLEYDTSLNLNSHMAFAHFTVGDIHRRTNDSLALKHYMLANELAYKENYTELIAALHYNCATIYRAYHQDAKAIEECKKVLDIYGEDHNGMMQVYDVWGKCLKNLGRKEEAIEIFNKILESPKASPRNLMYGHNSMSILYKENDELNKAIKHIEAALEIARENNLKNLKYGELLANLGSTLYEKGEYSASLYHYNEAKPYLLDTLNKFIANKAYLMESIVKSGISLSGDQKLIDDFEEFVMYNDQYLDHVQDQISIELVTKYKSELKEAENQKLEAQRALDEDKIDRQKKMLLGAGIAFFAICALSYFLYRQKNKQKMLNKNISVQSDHIRLLNRELNHRVKNNLAFMTSLLEMEKRRVGSEEAKSVLRDSETRLRTLSLMHTNLFRKKSDTKIELSQYLEEVVENLRDVFVLPDKSLKVNYRFDKFTVDAEDGVRVGLIVNELFTNSVKHAFESIVEPEISIETKTINANLIQLTYRDNGIGVDFIDDEKTSSESMGHKLIKLLSKQISSFCELKIR